MSLAFRLAILVCAAIALTGCGRSVSYRYKLTLSLDTPDGVKTGFNVIEERIWEVSIPARGVGHTTVGEAIYLDLGPARRPLIALLTHARRPNQRPQDIRWEEDSGSGVLVRSCLGVDIGYSDWFQDAAQLVTCMTPFVITTADLPDLVTFADVNDPKSVLLVDPNNLAAALGPGVAWRSMTLQATDEPLTKGIEKWLPWIPKLNDTMRLDGGVLGYGRGAPIANQLQRYDFSRFF